MLTLKSKKICYTDGVYWWGYRWLQKKPSYELLKQY
jgi:hypothetical protein